MPTTFTESDAEAIRALSDVHHRDIIDGEPDVFLSACTDDITLFPPDGSVISGRDEARSFLEDFPSVTEFDVVVEEVEGSGTIAFSRGHTTGVEEDGSSARFRWLAVHRKQEDGSWKMARDAWSEA